MKLWRKEETARTTAWRPRTKHQRSTGEQQPPTPPLAVQTGLTGTCSAFQRAQRSAVLGPAPGVHRFFSLVCVT